MRPADISLLVTLGRPTVSPDGRHAVVAASRADLDADEYRTSLWTVPTDGSTPPRPLTHGNDDSAPRYSPDGQWLAFLRAGDGTKPQLHLLPVRGGDARSITDLPLGAGAPVWSPDSTAVAFTARVPEPGRYGQDEKIPAEKEPPRRITGLTYRLDNIGFTGDRRRHVFVLDLAGLDSGAAVTQITDGDWDDSELAWAPDGSRLGFVSARHPDRELDRRSDVFLVDRDGNGLRAATRTVLSLDTFAFSDDGAALLLVGGPAGGGPTGGGPTGGGPGDINEGWLARNAGLYRVDIGDDPAIPVRLTDPETVHIGAEWVVVNGDHALVAVENRGALELLSVALDGSGVTVACGGRRQLTAIDQVEDVIVASYSDTTTSGELARIVVPPAGPSTFSTLTDFGAAARDVLVPVSELTATAPDGYPVHGFLALPRGTGPHPVLLMIHGGPFTQYGWTNLDEAQVYAAAGYAVVYGNPRGSSGYGEAHGRHIIGDVGERQAPDLLALLDAALGRDDLDTMRVGVLGGSHGGFMTTWLIGHGDRFRAAVSERAVNAIDSFEGSSDIGWDFADQLYGTDAEQRRRQSPLTYVDRIDTPLLIVHSEHDWRCPVEQGQRLYVALRKRRHDVEMLLFPGEGHELSRSGTPGHRVARFDAILDWFARHV